MTCDKDQWMQLLAVGLILAAAGCIALGSARAWHDLVTFALTFGGAGVGILTGQYAGRHNSGGNTANL